jgi:hypothetical protein
VSHVSSSVPLTSTNTGVRGESDVPTIVAVSRSSIVLSNGELIVTIAVAVLSSSLPMTIAVASPCIEPSSISCAATVKLPSSLIINHLENVLTH